MSGMYQSLISSSPWQQAQNTHGLTIFLSVHWGAPEEQTPTGIAESLRQHHQSLPLVWMIFINVGQKCDNCDESFYSEEELGAHIKIVHKNPTTGVVADHCLELKSVESEKEKDLCWRRSWSLINLIIFMVILVIVNILVSSWWRRSQWPTLSQLPKLCWIHVKWASKLWTDFSQEEERTPLQQSELSTGGRM